jgi:preprotein translocase subunit SecD
MDDRLSTRSKMVLSAHLRRFWIRISPRLSPHAFYSVGSGPVRGFAVTLGAGIVTTLFTAFSLTRMIIAWWVWEFRPRRVPI